MMKSHLILVAFLLLFITKELSCIRVKAVKILSKHIRKGDDVDLVCIYDLNNERIYSLKWYKEEREFFRIEGNKSVLQFPVKGIQLDKLKSNLHRIRLKNVNESTTGTYVCEISVEGSFYTEDSEAFLLVHADSRNHSTTNSLFLKPCLILIEIFFLHKLLFKLLT